MVVVAISATAEGVPMKRSPSFDIQELFG